MSHFADYKLEREGKETIEAPEGFVVFQIEAHQCYIVDIYVAPRFRRTKVATELADMVLDRARSNKCTELLGSVVPSANGSTESLKALLSYGFKLQSAQENFIWFVKEIS